MKKTFNEFKEFISKGNVVDMAVGVVIGSAFGLWREIYYSNVSNCYVECSIQVNNHESDETGARLRSGVLGNINIR